MSKSLTTYLWQKLHKIVKFENFGNNIIKDRNECKKINNKYLKYRLKKDFSPVIYYWQYLGNSTQPFS